MSEKNKQDNMISFNKEKEFVAMKKSVIAQSKQLDITIEKVGEIINKYNEVVEHQKEMFENFHALSMDNRIMKNILNQLKGFFEQNFPGYMNQPHFKMIRDFCDLLIDSSEEGIQKKEQFFAAIQREHDARQQQQQAQIKA